MMFKQKTFELIGKDENIFSKLCLYVDLIEENNKLFNLTGFKGDDLWREGIYQSIILMNHSFSNTKGLKMLDIGSGVGFPSIPFLIFKQDFSLFIAEPMKKRILFLKKINDALSLNITFICQRVEDYEQKEEFDLITARAVTALKNLIEISSKVGAINAQYSFLKGPKIYEELNEAEWIINELSIKIKIEKVQINLDNQHQQDHFLIKYNKSKKTPDMFPRPWSLIVSK